MPSKGGTVVEKGKQFITKETLVAGLRARVSAQERQLLKEVSGMMMPIVANVHQKKLTITCLLEEKERQHHETSARKRKHTRAQIPCPSARPRRGQSRTILYSQCVTFLLAVLARKLVIEDLMRVV